MSAKNSTPTRELRPRRAKDIVVPLPKTPVRPNIAEVCKTPKRPNLSEVKKTPAKNKDTPNKKLAASSTTKKKLLRSKSIDASSESLALGLVSSPKSSRKTITNISSDLQKSPTAKIEPEKSQNSSQRKSNLSEKIAVLDQTECVVPKSSSATVKSSRKSKRMTIVSKADSKTPEEIPAPVTSNGSNIPRGLPNSPTNQIQPEKSSKTLQKKSTFDLGSDVSETIAEATVSDEMECLMPKSSPTLSATVKSSRNIKRMNNICEPDPKTSEEAPAPVTDDLNHLANAVDSAELASKTPAKSPPASADIINLIESPIVTGTLDTSTKSLRDSNDKSPAPVSVNSENANAVNGVDIIDIIESPSVVVTSETLTKSPRDSTFTKPTLNTPAKSPAPVSDKSKSSINAVASDDIIDLLSPSVAVCPTKSPRDSISTPEKSPAPLTDSSKHATNSVASTDETVKLTESPNVTVTLDTSLKSVRPSILWSPDGEMRPETNGKGSVQNVRPLDATFSPVAAEPEIAEPPAMPATDSKRNTISVKLDSKMTDSPATSATFSDPMQSNNSDENTDPPTPAANNWKTSTEGPILWSPDSNEANNVKLVVSPDSDGNLNDTFSLSADEPSPLVHFVVPKVLQAGTPVHLRGIRKRSISLDCSGLSVMKLANKSVCFHSPSNVEMPIDEIDRIMEMSRTEETMNKENPVRRQRSKSATEPSATKRAPLTPRKVPDFKAIHERNFQRMESIVDYKNRREAASSRILKPKAKVQMKSRIPMAISSFTSAKVEAIKATAKIIKPVSRPKPNAAPSAAAAVKPPKLTTKSTTLSTAATTSSKPNTTNAAPSAAPIKLLKPTTNPTPLSITTSSSSAAWQPPPMAEMPSFAFGTKISAKTNATPSKSSSSSASSSDLINKRKAMLKGHVANSSQISARNAQAMKGVRSNRRFDLLMQFRQEKE